MNAAERAEALRAMLGAEPRFGAEIAWPDDAASANDLCHAAGRPGFAALAERQTAGRGTHGRTWEAPAGRGVLLSAAAPATAFADDAFLAALAAVGVDEALSERCRLACRFKWPNDVLVDGKKIAGALVERRRVAVLGVGINVLQTAAELPPNPRWPATSVALAWSGGDALQGRFAEDRIALAGCVLRSWDRWWRHAEEHGPEALHAAWQRRAWPSAGAGAGVAVALADGATARGELVSMRLDQGVTLAAAAREQRFPAARVAGVLPE